MGNDLRDINVTNAAIKTIPGQNATVIIFDSTANQATDNGLANTSLFARIQMPDIKRARLRLFADQAVTVFFDGVGRNSSTFRTVNNGGAGQAVPASTLYKADFNVGDEDDWRIKVTTPAGVITVWDVVVRLSTDQALAQ